MLSIGNGLARRLGIGCVIWFSFQSIHAQHALGKETLPPKIAAASNEGEVAIKHFLPASGLKVELTAAEPNLANPVAFYVDEKGKFYVVETFRLHAGVTDIREHMEWLDEDLANRTADDRLAMMKRHMGTNILSAGQHSERIKLVEDRNGDGKADFSTIFAEGFDHPLDGIAAGLIARKGNVWVTDIPNLWWLKDNNGDGKADERKSLSFGYGVRVGFLGHDLHGLRFGPDGKLYFSIGDRGSAIKVADKIVGNPDTGCVFRCNPDGSELEVFAYGLRNPQELAFDQYGNLFTGDNNSDGGDQARWVYVVEGSDSGWRVGFQFIESPNSRGPWNSEKMWYPQWEGQAAFLVPPIANIANGPSGTTYYPGTGLPDKYKEHFFLTDFHGGAGSGILSFALKPKGASFELIEKEKFLWECLPTDVDFGTEGGIYFTDWVQGWEMTGKGRIYRVFDPEVVKQPVVLETKKLRAEGFEKRSTKELEKLLGHADMRVRQEAQFELADRGLKSVETLKRAARKNENSLARLHAIWGLGQVIHNHESKAARGTSDAAQALIALLADSNSEVRAQAAKVLGDQRIGEANSQLRKLLADSDPRPRCFAAIALGNCGDAAAVSALIQMLRDNADRDPVLRHAAVMGLVGANDFDAMAAYAKDSSPSVRMGVLLAMRRLERAEISIFLHDSQTAIVTEAARAINDIPISGAMPELANLIGTSQLSEPALRRAVNANYRYGTRETAVALADFAKNGRSSETLRAEALFDLGTWTTPSGRDRITGLWRPTAGPRETKTASEAVRPIVADLLKNAPDRVRLAALKSVASLQIAEVGDELAKLVKDSSVKGTIRAEGLRTLASLHDSRAPELVQAGENDANEEVRKAAISLHGQGIGAGLQLAVKTLTGTLGERRAAITALGDLKGSEADQAVETLLKSIEDVPQELRLDLIEAAAKRSSATIADALKKYEAIHAKEDLAGYREALYGGNAEEGRKIFFEKAEAACVRCHKITGEGGEVGPDLSTVGARQNREYILESIVYPNKKIAPGFESLLVTTKKGMAYAGVVKSENDKEIVLNSPEDGIVTVQKSDITAREHGLSAMIEGLATLLTKQDLRNLVEFLATRK
jgi:quinoprotein glucose dehydrogenase